MPNLRTDYYSNKTFFALKNASVEELSSATKVVQSMLINILKSPVKTEESELLKSDRTNERIIEFLIIPRFLISK